MKPFIFLAALATLGWGQDESPFPPEEVRRLLAAGRGIELVDQGFHEPVPVGLLRKGIKYPPETLSLVADPSDRQDFLMALYLVNASDRPIEGIRFRGYPVAHQDIRVTGAWRSTDRQTLDCGNSVPEEVTRTLAPGQAMIFMGRYPGAGDTPGELRYRVPLDGGGEVSTRAMTGRYPAAELEAADLKSLERHTPPLPQAKGGKGPFDWADGYTAVQREALVARLELERMRGGFPYLREVTGRWLAFLDANEGDAECRQALHAMLEREWKSETNEVREFDHYLGILNASSDKVLDYGDPKRFPDVAWVCLSDLMKRGEILMQSRARDGALQPKQNPWGIPQEQAMAAVKLALERVRSSANPGENSAAGYLLNGSWITPNHFADEQVRALLKENSAACRKTALGILAQRGHSEEAQTWLLGRCEDLGDEALVLWNLVPRTNPMSAPETELVLKLLKRHPSEVFRELGRRASPTFDFPDQARLPEALRDAARTFLESELANPQVKGEAGPPVAGENRAARAYYNDAEGIKLSSTLYQVLTLWAHWKEPEDLDLLKRFLNHPAGHYEEALDGRHVKYFDVRNYVVDLLKKRGDPVPADVRLWEKQ